MSIQAIRDPTTASVVDKFHRPCDAQKDIMIIDRFQYRSVRTPFLLTQHKHKRHSPELTAFKLLKQMGLFMDLHSSSGMAQHAYTCYLEE